MSKDVQKPQEKKPYSEIIPHNISEEDVEEYSNESIDFCNIGETIINYILLGFCKYILKISHKYY